MNAAKGYVELASLGAFGWSREFAGFNDGEVVEWDAYEEVHEESVDHVGDKDDEKDVVGDHPAFGRESCQAPVE